MQPNAKQSLVLFTNGISLENNRIMSELYQQYKDEDGFLYFSYSISTDSEKIEDETGGIEHNDNYPRHRIANRRSSHCQHVHVCNGAVDAVAEHSLPIPKLHQPIFGKPGPKSPDNKMYKFKQFEGRLVGCNGDCGSKPSKIIDVIAHHHNKVM